MPLILNRKLYLYLSIVRADSADQFAVGCQSLVDCGSRSMVMQHDILNVVIIYPFYFFVLFYLLIDR
jgi:hypothetical protein